MMTAQKIKCGNCKNYHDSVNEVRACCAGSLQHFQMEKVTRPAIEMKQRIEITEGMWCLGERIIKIQRAVHGSGHLYGKELIVRAVDPTTHDNPTKAFEGEWVKITGAVKLLERAGGRKMTLEEAQEFGRLYGVCCRCGAILTDEGSIAAGIGPVCAGKW